MRRKERERMTVMTGVKREELTLVQTGELMAVCYRQSKRISRRYQDAGDEGLVHRLRGKPSARRKPPELRAQADGGRPAPGASPEATAPAMAGTAAELRGDGATGRVTPRLVRGARPQVRADGDGGRRDQRDARPVLRGGDHSGELRRVGRLGAQAWLARQLVCGSGQHLPLRRRGEHCRATG